MKERSGAGEISVAGVEKDSHLSDQEIQPLISHNMVIRYFGNVNIKRHALSSPYIHIPTIDPKTEENARDFCRLT